MTSSRYLEAFPGMSTAVETSALSAALVGLISEAWCRIGQSERFHIFAT